MGKWVTFDYCVLEKNIKICWIFLKTLKYNFLFAIFYYKKNRANIMHKYLLLGNFAISAQISWSFAILCRVCCFAHISHNGSGSSHVLQKCVAWTSLLSFEQGMHIIFVSLFVVLLQDKNGGFTFLMFR